MDFEFSTEAHEAATLTAQILDGKLTSERHRELDGRFDPVLWRDLAEAGLLEIGIGEAEGGAGLGLFEVCRTIEECGRKVAPVPFGPHVMATRFLSEYCEGAVREDVLPKLLGGSAIVGIGINEPDAFAPERPSTTARLDGADWLVNGAKALVRSCDELSFVLVTATTDDGVGVFLIDTSSRGVDRKVGRVSDGDHTGTPLFTDAPATLIGTADGQGARRLSRLAAIAAASEQLGVLKGAVALTSAYAAEREQFGRPIATFQAVSQRLADGYIDTLCSELPLWQAIWQLDEGWDDERVEVAVAEALFWAAEAGHRVAHTTVHVHGGVGIDLDGDAHRYFTAAKRLEFAFGGSSLASRRIGAALAAQPV